MKFTTSKNLSFPKRMLLFSMLSLFVFVFCLYAFTNPDSNNQQLSTTVETEEEKTEFMFVQTASSAVIGLENGKPVLTLVQVNPNTTYFSDRPERITGIAPNAKFLDGMCFDGECHDDIDPNIRQGKKDPPNAAIVFMDENQQQQVVILELMYPNYNPANATLTYQYNILAEYNGKSFKHHKDKALKALPLKMDNVNLFIDDCSKEQVYCFGAYVVHDGRGCRVCCGRVPGGKKGYCWNWPTLSCQPCRDYSSECNCRSGGEYCESGCVTDGPECMD